MIDVDYAVKSGNPYVYMLCYPNGVPFYVGKGSGKRIYSHLKEAQGPGNTHKLNAIRSILHDSGEILLRIDSIHDSDEKAFAREKLLIFQYGRKNNKTGTLTNLREGGQGLPVGSIVKGIGAPKGNRNAAKDERKTYRQLFGQRYTEEDGREIQALLDEQGLTQKQYLEKILSRDVFFDARPVEAFQENMDALSDLFATTNEKFQRMWTDWKALNLPGLSEDGDDYVNIRVIDLRRILAAFMQAGKKGDVT